MNSPRDHHSELAPLVAAAMEQTISDTDWAKLMALLKRDPDARRAYLRLMCVHGQMVSRYSHRESKAITIAAPAAPIIIDEPAPGSAPAPRSLPIRTVAFAVAATLLAACGVAIYLLAFNATPTPDPEPSQPGGPPVATLIHNTGDLRTPHGYPAEGDDYGRGEYTLSSGTAEFMLTNAVNVKLRGDTRLVMRNDMNVSLTHGSAEFVVPPNATGFTVRLPDDSEIIDLGTSFRVRIDRSGRAQVSVTEGSVVWTTAGELAESFLLDKDEQAHLVDGSVRPFASRTRSVRLVPVADTYVDRRFADQSFGDDDRIVANEWQKSGPRWAYIRFDLGEIGGPIEHAQLRLKTAVGNSTDDAYHVFGLISETDWIETGDNAVIWNNAPARKDDRVDLNGVAGGAPLARFTTTTPTGQALTAFDTDAPALIDFLNDHRGGTVTLLIAAPPENPSAQGDAWASRETDTPPVLTLQFVDRIDETTLTHEESETPSQETQP